jgi:hypothetical protein
VGLSGRARRSSGGSPVTGLAQQCAGNWRSCLNGCRCRTANHVEAYECATEDVSVLYVRDAHGSLQEVVRRPEQAIVRIIDAACG